MPDRKFIGLDSLPKFSADIEAAWQVFDAFTNKLSGREIRENVIEGVWTVTFQVGIRIWISEAETFPLAVCRTALKTIANA